MGSPLNQSPTVELTSLAAHLRRLSDRIDQISEAHTELAATISTQLAPELGSLRNECLEQLGLHAEQIHQLNARAAAKQIQPIKWPSIPADQAATAWTALANWIAEVLVPWYQLTREDLPDCWALHKPVVVELSWLHTAHLEAFQPGAAAYLAADWHTRWRPATLMRLREIIPRRGQLYCGPGQHLITDAERARRQPTPSCVIATSTGRQQLPNEQLAERDHWQPFLEHAVAEDRHWRLSREV
jgi:hypothetical protein